MTGSRSRAGTALAALVAVAALTLAGCGNEDPSPAAEVPSLAGLLTTVDDAIAGGRYLVARRQLDALVESTIEARDSGDLDGADADRILAAAAELRALLPEPLPEDKDPVTESPKPEPDPDRTGGDGDGGDGGKGDKGDKPGKGKGKGHGKGGKR